MTIEIENTYPATPIPSTIVVTDATGDKLIIQNVGAILISTTGNVMLESQEDLITLINALNSMRLGQ